MAARILIVDDERDICEILQFNLASEGYEVDCANSAEEALEKLTPDYALILLDVMMGEMSGFRLAEHIRKSENPIPIIFITARDKENDMLTAFSVGGDDYIAKPFSIKEVIARVKALLKRVRQTRPIDTSHTTVGELSLDKESKEVKLHGQLLSLTRKEYEILQLLLLQPGRFFTREEILDRIWPGDSFVTDRTVDVHIFRIRKKLGEYALHLDSKPGYGYRLTTTQ